MLTSWQVPYKFKDGPVGGVSPAYFCTGIHKKLHLLVFNSSKLIIKSNPVF